MCKIDDPRELQFRQAHPIFLENGSPSRQVFLPTSKDKGLLSLDRSASTTPREAHENFVALGLQSEAVFGLMAGEFEASPHGIGCFASPIDEAEHKNPHHSHADFNNLSKSQRKAKSFELKRLAEDRGKLFP